MVKLQSYAPGLPPKPLDDLQIPPGNQPEALGRDRRGQFSIRINRQRGLTPSTALRLAKYCGTSPDFWMHLQLRWDLYHAQRAEAHGKGLPSTLFRIRSLSPVY